MNREPFPFWEFSLAVYGRPGVAELCLALQDGWGADVNLLLACLWLGERGRALCEAELAALVAAVAPWQIEVVAPLRHVRRRLKAEGGNESVPELRKAVAEAELDAEYLEQRRIARLVDALPAGAAEDAETATKANLRAYAVRLGRAGDERAMPLWELSRRR